MDGGELEDLEFALAVGGDDGGDVADLFAEQGAADGGGGRDEALGDIGLFAGDELVGELFFLGAVEDDDGGAIADFVAGDVIEVDHGELAHALFKLTEARVDELLALLGGVVLGVFGEIAEGDRLLDLRRQLRRELALQQLNLFFQSLLNMIWHGAFRNLLTAVTADVWMLVQVAFFSEENTRKTGRPATAAGGRPRPASAPAALAQIKTPLYVPRPHSPNPPRPGSCPNLDSGRMARKGDA